jgi:ubiquinone/menaquinone biosynthesis C-methylase UbiE
MPFSVSHTWFSELLYFAAHFFIRVRLKYSILKLLKSIMAYKSVINAADPNVTCLYGERTALTSCVYLRPYIKETSNILDVGCGPGIITSDLAKIASKGRTIGVDISEGIIEQASKAFPPSAVPNLTYTVGDANTLEGFEDNAYDIVHAHALIVHTEDPVQVLKQFYRVCKPGGIVAVREANPSIVLSLKPDIPAIRQYWERSTAVLAKMGGHPDAGKMLETWAKEAGFGSDGGKIVTSTSPQFQAGHLVRMSGAAAEQAIQWGMATKEEMEHWKKGWEDWEAAEGHEWIFQTGEILCWKGE